MRPLLDRVRQDETLLADGALGTLLMQQGLRPGDPPETFSLDRPEVLSGIIAAYIAAGAEIVQLNTFGANRLKLEGTPLAGRYAELNETAVKAADVARGRAYLWASLGPTGRLLKPFGNAEPTAVSAAYEAQARVLVRSGVDIIAVETMIDLNEALLAVMAVRKVSPDIPLAATLTFEKKQRGFHTVMGATVEAACKELVAAGADLVGSNCGCGASQMVELACEFREKTDKPLVFRPNAGIPEIRSGQTVYPETPEYMAELLPLLLELRPAIVGGCCGTTPAHISAFRQVLSSR